MKISALGIDFTIKFCHFIADSPKVTMCTIKSPNGAFSGAGYALCSMKDQFNRARGRKIAFARAVQSTFTDRANRALFWDAMRQERKSIIEHGDQELKDKWAI